MLLKKRYLFLILIVCLFAISNVSAEDNSTSNVISISDDINSLEVNIAESNANSIVNDTDTLKVSNDEILTAENNWYVNSSKTGGGDGKSEATAFNTLNEALAVVQDGNTIMIASGEYKGTNNTGLTINKNLNFIKYGDGEAVLDAESKNRIWTVTATSINITGLTFKNGRFTSGSAIAFNNALHDFNINATFINNTATDGGAIYIYGNVSGNLTGSFKNNKAENKGGAIYIGSGVSGNLAGSFINNTATNGGVIYIYDGVSGNLAGSFINNTAGYGGAIYISNNGISGSLTGSFINNRAIGDGAGAIHIDRGDVSGSLTGSFINNIAKYDGAAINCDVVSGNLNGSFINNTASRGGAIFIYGDLSGNLTGIFINNTVGSTGGAIYFNSCLFGSLTGSFINNIAKYDGSVIYINDNLGENANIKDSIFINNTIISTKGNITVINSWFGNNASNYNTKPTPGNVTMDNWLFLNATANPTELNVGDTSTITFKLHSYNETSKEITPYDASKVNAILELSQTLGELNQTTALIGEDILYAAKQGGDASVSGRFETVFYNVILKNNGSEPILTNITVNPTSLDLTVGESGSIIATLNPSEAGSLKLNCDSDIIKIKGGPTGDWIVTGVAEGNAIITFSFPGNGQYAAAENKTVNVTVNAKPAPSINVVADNLTKYYGGSEPFSVNVTDDTGKGISGKTVFILINGVNYNRTTDENGTASLGLNLNSGVYNVASSVDNQTVSSVVTVLSTVNGTDIVKMYRNDTQYYATFIDTEGKFLTDGTVVKFNINGVVYERKVSGDKGLAKLNINLPAGEYVITAINTVTGENAANNITVLSTVVENRDITKYYRNATQYTVKVLGADGNPVGEGKIVTFNINGVMYQRQTNASSIAQLNINLPPGDYVITASYDECSVANNITVLPVLSASNLKMKYMDGSKFKATLLDGQGKPYAGQKVQFNVNGVLYSRTTDSNGRAELNIRLLPGEYIITSSYNGCNIANKITITP